MNKQDIKQRFKPGDLAIYVRPGSPHYGVEVEVLSELSDVYIGYDHMTGECNKTEPQYQITNIINHPVGFAAKPEWLKPKKRQNPDVVETQQSKSWESLKRQWNKVAA